MRDSGLGLQYECMRAGSRLIFGGYTDCALAEYRAFMLAHTTANAQPGIDVWLLQAYLNRYRLLPLKRHLNWNFSINRQTAGCIGDDASSLPVRIPWKNAKIITGGILIGNQYLGLKFDSVAVGGFDNQWLLDAHGIEQLPGKDGLGADRTVFLTNDAGPIHGPG